MNVKAIGWPRLLVAIITVVSAVAAVMAIALYESPHAHADARCDALRAKYGAGWPCISVPNYTPPTTPPAVTTAPSGPTDTGTGPNMHVDAGPGPGTGNGTPIVPVPGAPVQPPAPAAGMPSQASSDAPTSLPDVISMVPRFEADGPSSSYPAPGSFGKMGKNEQKTCALNPIDCARAKKAPSQAMSESAKYFNDTKTDGKQDAAKHCIWQGLTTEMANIGFAEDIANAHEKDWPNNIKGSSDMDRFNK